MLSFLKLVRNWPKNAVLNLALCCGAIWRQRAKPQYRCTTTIHPVHNSPKDVLENLPPLWRLVHAHNLVHSEPFLDYRYEVWRLVSALCSDVRKKLYIGAHLHTFSALNYCSGIFFKSLSYLYEVVRTNFSVDFGTFRNFWPQFREPCGAI